MRSMFLTRVVLALVAFLSMMQKQATGFAPSFQLQHRRHGTLLLAKKKAAPPASKKMQVKLLKHIAGTGQAGDVVLVSPAFYNNQLRPQKAAEPITDDEYEEQQKQEKEAEIETTNHAKEIKEKLDETVLEFARKAGPEGHLFGGIGPKVIMDELQSLVNDDFLNQKSVKVTALADENDKKMRGDIKEVGTYFVSISLLKDISAKVKLVVKSE